jgi:molybdopterin-guanine dinucleotide biosynthesis protein A
MTSDASITAIVLAGGRARRLGQPKPSATVGSDTLLSRALTAVSALPTVVVGPPELSDLIEDRPNVTLVQESPPFAGPVAGIAAGWSLLGTHRPNPDWLILLACDLPRAPEAIQRLLAALPDLDGDTAGVCLTIDDHPQWLCGIYRAPAVGEGLERLELAGGLDSIAVRALLGPLNLRLVPDADGVGFDVDTPDDLRAANAADAARSGDERSPA